MKPINPFLTRHGREAAQPFFALEFYGEERHFGVVEEPTDGFASVRSASLSGTKETEVWGKDAAGENDALALGGLKLSGEKTGYMNAFEMPDTSGTMTVAGVPLAIKGFNLDASNEDFTMGTKQGIGAPGLNIGG